MVNFEVTKVIEPESIGKEDVKEHNYDEAVDLAGNGIYNITVLSACSIIVVAVALDMFAFGIVIAAGSCDLRLTLQEKGLLTSIPFSGIFFAFFWGYYADSAGRRKALIWSTAGGFLFAALTSIAAEWYTMLVLKFVGCSFSSASFSLSMTYLGESTGITHRGRYMQILNCFNLASETISFILAYLILNLSFNIPIPLLGITFRPWRLLTLVYALFLGAGALMMLLLHESPKFLASSGNVGEAMEVLKKIFRSNVKKHPDFYVVKSIKLPQQHKAEGNFILSMAKSIVPLFKPPLLTRTMLMFYLIVVICTTNNAFTVWFPAIVNTFFLTLGGEDQSFCQRINVNTTNTEDALQPCIDKISNLTIYCGMVYGLFFTGLNLFIAKVAKWRRVVLITTFLVSAASCVLVDLVDKPAANIVFFALLQATSICIGIAGSYFNDLFPTSHRALATSLGMMMARIGSFSGINLIGAVIADHCRTAFFSWAVFVLSGVLTAFLLPSDTKISKINLNN